jgi:hypothetical protein
MLRDEEEPAEESFIWPDRRDIDLDLARLLAA